MPTVEEVRLCVVTGFRTEYVEFSNELETMMLDVGKIDGALVVSALELISGIFDVLETGELPTPTQYASPSQKFVKQSLEIAGFHAKNWSRVMPKAAGTVSQVSPLTIVCHLLQFVGEPENVGAAGVESQLALEEACRPRKWWCLC